MGKQKQPSKRKEEKNMRCNHGKFYFFVLAEFNMLGKSSKDGKTKTAFEKKRRKEYAIQSW